MKVSVQLHAPAVLPQGKSRWYPLDKKLGGPQSRSEHPDYPARSLVTTPTELKK
jgi:hypothetical protein